MEKNMGIRDWFVKKTEALYATFNKRVEAATIGYSATGDFCNMFILWLWLKIISRSYLGLYFIRNFPSQMFFNDINHGYRAAILKKTPMWLLAFHMTGFFWLLWKRCAEQCALQLYRTSLKKGNISEWRLSLCECFVLSNHESFGTQFLENLEKFREIWS